MGNRRARTDQEILERRNEIVNACISVALEKGFNNINIREISQITSFSRTSIYTYYRCKEEVFLDILKHECTSFFDELKVNMCSVLKNAKSDYCNILSSTLVKYDNLLMLLSKHMVQIESNCRIENLASYNDHINSCFKDFDIMTKSIFPNSDSQNIELFRVLFFSTISSLYNLANPTEKRTILMQTTKPYKVFNLYDILYKHTLLIANSL